MLALHIPRACAGRVLLVSPVSVALSLEPRSPLLLGWAMHQYGYGCVAASLTTWMKAKILISSPHRRFFPLSASAHAWTTLTVMRIQQTDSGEDAGSGQGMQGSSMPSRETSHSARQEMKGKDQYNRPITRTSKRAMTSQEDSRLQDSGVLDDSELLHVSR